MRHRWSLKIHPAWALATAPALALAGLSLAAWPAAAHVVGHRPHGVAPRKLSEVDCNGWSPKYKAIVAAHRMTCVDSRGPRKLQGKWSNRAASEKGRGRFEDNGHYIGHDEPSVKFISAAHGSGNRMTYYLRLPKDPRRRATNDGKVVKYAELSVAPWFGLPLCAPK